MSLTTNLIIFIASIVVLAASGHVLVRSLLKIAYFLHIKTYVLAFILMAFATSIPELFVGIYAGLSKASELSLGNVLGSNIADMTIVLGITILLARKLKITEARVKKDAWATVFIAALPLVLIINGVLTRLEGLILVAVFIIYMVYLVSQKKANQAHSVKDKISRWQFLGYIVLFSAAVAGLLISADFTVKSAVEISSALNLPLLLIGLILVALGTSLPELAFNVAAVFKGFSDLALGDVLGSVVINSTLVLGITAMITPITAPIVLLFSSGILMMVSLFIFLAFVQHRTINWSAGIALVMLYVLFIFVELTIRGVSIS